MNNKSKILSVKILWFKRDLRIHDNIALVKAALNGPVLPLYIFEPELWKQPDLSYRHFKFLTESLEELNNELNSLGQNLIIRVGDAVEVFNKLFLDFSFDTIWSHQETWNHWTYDRDKKVKAWAKQNNITWNEMVQNGVIRALKDRTKWKDNWYGYMNQPLKSFSNKLTKLEILSDQIPSPKDLNLTIDDISQIQKGGRSEGLKLLQSFLYNRGEDYSRKMSSPLTAYESCSRLSTHLAFGTLSIREIFKNTQKRYLEIKQFPKEKQGKWLSAFRSFLQRLRWHCHFIQKLEDQPLIEFENMHSAYNGLRENDFNNDYFEAWKIGHTGYPMIDACMRALIRTGWVNFRMRAMLVSFASYHLWLHWRKPALYLANLFTDYEPGIHYSQIQMQSGTTGINTIRIYNPIKQGFDHDPEGVFVKTWVPELSEVPTQYIHTPWLYPLSDSLNYPKPIVDENKARNIAASKIYALRKNDSHKQEAKLVLKKHTSPKNSQKNNKPLLKQLELKL